MDYGIYPLIIVSILLAFVMIAVLGFRRSVTQRQKKIHERAEEEKQKNKS